MQHGVILLPGIVTPAHVAYVELLEALGKPDRIVAQELAIYDGDTPPGGYGLDTEVAAVLDAAESHGFDRFHIAGYSFGGAVAAALTARHPGRVLSLGLWEPAWFGNDDMSDAERRTLAEIEKVAELPPEEGMMRFVELNNAPGVKPPAPPSGPQPPWMAKRPAAIRAVGPAFHNHTLDMAALRAFRRPVLYVLCALSNPVLYRERAERAQSFFRDFTLEIFEERNHFDPPHRAEPERLGKLLEAFWSRAESAAGND